MIEPTPGEPIKRTNKLLIIALAFVILLIPTLFFAYKYGSPHWELAKAVTNTLNAKSIHIKVEAPLISDLSFTYDSDATTDENLFIAKDMVISFPMNDKKEASFKISGVSNGTDEYFKPYSSLELKLYNQFLTDFPEMTNLKSFQSILPVISGDSWVHSKRVALKKDKETLEPIKIYSAFKAIVYGFNFKTVQKDLVKDSVSYDRYVLGIKSDTVETFLNGFKNEMVNIKIDDLNTIIKSLKNSTDIKDVLITLDVDRDQKFISSIEIDLPKSVIKEISDTTGEPDKLANSFAYLASEPFSFTKLLSVENEKTKVIATISQVNSVKGQMVPKKYIEFDTLEDEGDSLTFYLLYMGDKDAILRASSPTNVYATTSHETKLLFDQGNYSGGLIKAQELLSLAKTNEEQAIANYWLGLHSFKLGKIDDAETFLTKAASLKDKYAAPYVTLGAIDSGKGNFQKMLSDSLKCVEYDPNYSWCYNNLGLSYLYLGQKDLGLSALQKAVSLDPTNFTFNDNLKRAKEQF